MSKDINGQFVDSTKGLLEVTEYPKVCIIILNWNGLQDTNECLESIRKISYPNYEVIVVDNASTGNDTEVLKEKFGDYIRLIENRKNYGFSEGNNIGMRYALSNNPLPDYFLLLNNDTTVAPDFLTELVKVAESDPEIGIVGPKIYFYDFEGRKNVIWSAGGKVCWWHEPFYYHLGPTHNDSPKYQVVKDVGFVSGAAMMLKSHVAEEISFLNSQYFFGYEEIECCMKARKAGYKIIYVPNAKVWHKARIRYRSGYNPTIGDLTDYYYLIRNNFSPLVYYYHWMLLPILLFKWGITYLKRYRDKATLYKFLSDFSRFIIKRKGD
ncbi:MAG: Glycosyl transferase family 2 [Candidatus Argoarchaeum ethanivorans]|uniref:Glycosyl transferase family 2 n=1 Tax=Candidatus Argoarchaeum ethanivorans TaxID=2608793 RepID=A0A811TFG6_9EURY|nr:MAG: Glycosyl transferase family 2 [Candidatus Argoarchaeum ethanivorans]